MKILFCKIVHMKYYKGKTIIDKPYGRLRYIMPEIHNFNPHFIERIGKKVCSGDARYGDYTSPSEKLSEDTIDDVLVVYFTTTETKENIIVGWYKHATVERYLYKCTFLDKEHYFLNYNMLADYENCVLLPYDMRILWKSPYSKYRSYVYGFSQLDTWYKFEEKWYNVEEKIENYPEELIERINTYNGENWIDKYPD